MATPLYLSLCVTLFGLLSLTTCQQEYREECEVWKNVTQMLSNEPRVNMQCTTNTQCTGFDCTGTYTYSGMLSPGEDIIVDFCFGMAIHPCSHPLDMHFYVAMPDYNSFFQQTVRDDEQVQLPGVHYNVASLGVADGFVHVDMDPEEIDGHQYVKLGMTFKVRIKPTFMDWETYPPNLQRTLMPDTHVPVPACEPGVRTPTEAPDMCHVTRPPPTSSTSSSGTKPTVPAGQTTPMVSTTSPPPTTTTPKGKVCKYSQAHGCENGEMCVPDSGDSDSGVCQCLTGYSKATDKAGCVSEEHPDIVIPLPHEAPAKKKKSNNIAIIVGGVAGGVVMVAIVLIVIVIKYKKFQARYGQHDMLLNSDDDDPLEVAT